MIEASRLSELVGKTLLGSSGVRVGKVTRVYADAAGEGTFASVRTGLFGGHASFVPLAEAELHGDNVHVPYAKELVEQAPRVADGQELAPADEDRLLAHYGSTPPPAPPQTGDGTMTRSEERLHVGTERVETGRARLRKYVVTETVTRTVPVSHEELRVVREPLAPGDPDVPQVDALSEEVHEVVLSAERPVVQKEVVPVERIRLSTETVTGEETVTEQVRKEQVEVQPDLPPAAPASGLVAERTSEVFIAPRVAEPKEDSGTSSELFVAPRVAEPKQDGGTWSEVFVAPGVAEPKDDSGTSSEFFVAPKEAEPKDDSGTTSEFFVAPKEAEPKDDSGTTSEFFIAPREDTPGR